MDQDYLTPQYRLYSGVNRTDVEQVRLALVDGARWDINQWDRPVNVDFGKRLICLLLGRDKNFSALPGKGPNPTNESLSILRFLLDKWPPQWPHWDGPLVNELRLLHLCAYKLSPRVVGFLLGMGADPNAVEEGGWLPLHVANNSEITQQLIDSGTNIQHESDEGLTAMDQYIGLNSNFSPLQTKRFTEERRLQIYTITLATLSSPSISARLKQACEQLVSCLDNFSRMDMFMQRCEKNCVITSTYMPHFAAQKSL